MNDKEAEELTKEFFKRRFPEKDIEFEKKVGYFYEWVNRFKSGEPEGYMDRWSLKIWEQMKLKIFEQYKGVKDNGDE